MNGHGVPVAEQTVKAGGKAARPVDPEESGYTFDGWYADEAFSKKFDFNNEITANKTVYAKWTKNTAAPTDPTTPKTGDSSNMFPWIDLLIVSGYALVRTIESGKKRSKKTK